MKKHEIVCDLCGVTVAEHDECCFFGGFNTRRAYIKVPYNYIGSDFSCGFRIPCNAKKDFHICGDCISAIKKHVKNKE
jgi:hypothetical protein